MENTNEFLEENVLDSVVLEESEQVAEHSGEIDEFQEEKEEIGVTNDDDATMSVLRRYPKVCARIAELINAHAESVALEIIGKGLDFDNAIANADKEGYVRGKNEKIELVKGHRMTQLDEISEEIGNESMGNFFPRYRKRSFWEGMQ